MKSQRSKYKLKKGIAEKIIRGEPIAPSPDSPEAGDDHRLASLNESEADESAGEGTGDGNIGRTTRNSEE